MNCIDVIKERIKFLEELVAITPVDKSFTAQSRLAEANFILELVKFNDEVNQWTMMQD